MSEEQLLCFLVEWYRPELTLEPCQRTAAVLCASAESMTAQGDPVELVMLVAIPADEALFGLFTADSAAMVAQTCDQAGISAQRLTQAADIALPHKKFGMSLKGSLDTST